MNEENIKLHLYFVNSKISLKQGFKKNITNFGFGLT